jgi:catechol 2,3-dioxygenase-like lactoylglutathione lyase family enzyme
MIDTSSRRLFLAGAAALVAAPLLGQTVIPQSFFGPARDDAGWAEAVVVVRSLARTTDWLGEVAGWSARRADMATPAAVLRLWGLPEGAEGRERVLGNAGDESGLVRLVELENAGPQVEIRGNGMTWDTGGVFSLMTRSRSLDAVYARHQAMGYSAFNEPTDFDFGGVVLRNIVLRGPDGVNIAIYERRSPLLVGWQTIRKLSAPFNAMQMVRDVAAAQRFYATLFGYVPVAAGAFLDPALTPNNFALPQNVAMERARRYAILAIEGAEVGRVEPMNFEGLEGRDLSERARFPNYGVAGLRFPTGRLAATLGKARAMGIVPSPVVEAVLEPWGRVRLAQVRSPDGVIIELMERTR